MIILHVIAAKFPRRYIPSSNNAAAAPRHATRAACYQEEEIHPVRCLFFLDPEISSIFPVVQLHSGCCLPRRGAVEYEITSNDWRGTASLHPHSKCCDDAVIAAAAGVKQTSGLVVLSPNPPGYRYLSDDAPSPHSTSLSRGKKQHVEGGGKKKCCWPAHVNATLPLQRPQ